ncbi:paraquat-inducible protein A [Aestuariirhabdus litorea]|uniref:Paraquat-inducible protein A n=1 Tax=Aestuariirhabdus litorea TaxID=2528527 RepID=A0A3P3VL12_9GAMM|nr:paraquat-inducible protein A [Aestuariirhabdus litorea]RRJ83432.1 paraquat-inducible protein A [Aestuariirhabdus litorea]RWW93594.1 paraquat-inducible protein A [Endozoicomonadaceae bacterium GTF-13]
MDKIETAFAGMGDSGAHADIAETHIACLSCDTLIDISGLAHGERAKCPVCGDLLTEYRDDGVSRVVAFSVAAVILLAMACAYPFLSFKSAGLESVTTLPGTVIALYDYGMADLAFLVGSFIIAVPLLVLLLLLLLCTPLVTQRRAPWMIPVGRIVFALQHWCMVDVFLIGVIVSLVKIAAMATVVLGISFFAYAGFAICFTMAMASLDRLQFWLLVERLMRDQARG